MVDFNSLFDENGDIEDGGNQKVVDQQEDEGLAADEAEEDEVKFIYSEKATKFCEIFPFLLTVCTVVKSKGKIWLKGL